MNIIESIKDNAKKFWQTFSNKDPTKQYDEYTQMGPVSYIRPDRANYKIYNERTVINTVINRMAVDASNISMTLRKQNDDGQFLGIVDSEFNDILNIQANIDQSGMSFVKNIVEMMLNDGVACVFPTVLTANPYRSTKFKIVEMRVGTIVKWSPKWVMVRGYDDRTGQQQEVRIPKALCAIIENPFWSIMNDNDSTMQRLNKKIAMLDNVDEQISSGKLDIIIQLPYAINSDVKRAQAEARKRDIEMQLVGSRYGIAYTDGAEKITQLNRPAENTLQQQIEYLTKQLFAQLGITDTILNGTADENTMNNYYKRVISPILKTITSEFNRKFLSKTALTQGQRFKFNYSQLDYISASQLGTTADAFLRNAILSANEVRSLLGYKPSKQPEANKLQNPNMPQEQPAEGEEGSGELKAIKDSKEDILNQVRSILWPNKNQNEKRKP